MQLSNINLLIEFSQKQIFLPSPRFTTMLPQLPLLELYLVASLVRGGTAQNDTDALDTWCLDHEVVCDSHYSNFGLSGRRASELLRGVYRTDPFYHQFHFALSDCIVAGLMMKDRQGRSREDRQQMVRTFIELLVNADDTRSPNRRYVWRKNLDIGIAVGLVTNVRQGPFYGVDLMCLAMLTHDRLLCLDTEGQAVYCPWDAPGSGRR
jgi:hypothetical protein